MFLFSRDAALETYVERRTAQVNKRTKEPEAGVSDF
jgi:hypothetical protein